MMFLSVLVIISLCFALIPALVYFRNVREFVPVVMDWNRRFPAVSILIPARNEAKSIGLALDSILLEQRIELEVIVLDDHSEDETRSIVERYAQKDNRVRVESAPELPEGWCGKQHACFQLSKLAKHDIFLFLDADVRLKPDGIAKMLLFLEDSKAPLVSCFPKQETGTFLEKLVIPLMHFLLLGFLPIHRMRGNARPEFGAGCGQFFVAHRSAYETVGGHSAVRTSLHDGLKLPRAFRQAGFSTDVTDGTAIASCRMYRSAGEVWLGLAKNAREGLGNPKLLLPSTLLLLGGQVLPVSMLSAVLVLETWQLFVVICALFFSYFPRLDAAKRFQQSWLGAILHPLGILSLLSIQWYANVRHWMGKPVGWKGRKHPTQAMAS